MITTDNSNRDYVMAVITIMQRGIKMTKKEKASQLRTSVSKTLAAARMMNEMSQEELADKIGTKKSSISRIENGQQNLTVDYVAAMAEALGREASFVMEKPSPYYSGDITEYSLKLYDEELMRFKLERGLDLKCEILYINEDRQNMLPLEMEVSEEGVLKWLEKRIVPQNRDLVERILGSLGLDINELKGIIDVCMGLSLNDSYWVTRDGFAGSFSEYNLFENRFSNALSLIAYTGGQYETKDFRTSPELTTGGMLRKAWRFSSHKGIWLYKGGTEGFANTGNEPYCEYYASQVADQMGLNAVKYELENWKGILASKCKIFTDIDTSYIPIGRIVRTGGIDACLKYYRDLGEEYYQELVSMLVFDAVIVNEDRHFGNFGVMRDNHTGRIIASAPIFDNGIALLCYAMKDDFDNINDYILKRTNPYGKGNQYFDLCKRIMGPIQKRQLRKLINFKFKESDLSNLPTWRLDALEKMIQSRVETLLTL